jgi:hypothetical protein
VQDQQLIKEKTVHLKEEKKAGLLTSHIANQEKKQEDFLKIELIEVEVVLIDLREPAIAQLKEHPIIGKIKERAFHAINRLSKEEVQPDPEEVVHPIVKIVKEHPITEKIEEEVRQATSHLMKEEDHLNREEVVLPIVKTVKEHPITEKIEEEVRQATSHLMKEEDHLNREEVVLPIVKTVIGHLIIEKTEEEVHRAISLLTKEGVLQDQTEDLLLIVKTKKENLLKEEMIPEKKVLMKNVVHREVQVSVDQEFLTVRKTLNRTILQIQEKEIIHRIDHQEERSGNHHLSVIKEMKEAVALVRRRPTSLLDGIEKRIISFMVRGGDRPLTFPKLLKMVLHD